MNVYKEIPKEQIEEELKSFKRVVLYDCGELWYDCPFHIIEDGRRVYCNECKIIEIKEEREKNGRI